MIIKCPECGHQVSDKAPVCPSCGVKIADHIIHCSYCGEIYLDEEEICPNCHHTPIADSQTSAGNKENAQTSCESPKDSQQHDINEEVGPIEHQDNIQKGKPQEPIVQATPISETASNIYAEPIDDDEPEVEANNPVDSQTKEKQKKNNHVALLISFVIAAIICFVLLYFYQDKQKNNEAEAFTEAIQSQNPDVIQQYLNKYKQTISLEHRNEAESLLKKLTQSSENWNAVLSKNDRKTFQDYLNANPNTPYKQVILSKLDSIDWASAVKKNTEDAYAEYIAAHSNGAHTGEAGKLAQQLMSQNEKKAQESAQKAADPIRRFLVGMNTKSTSAIEGCMASSFSFNGTLGASIADINKYMADRLYQADVKNINWHMEQPTSCDPIEQDGKTVGYKLSIPAKLEITREGGTPTLRYQISASVSADNKITSISLNRMQ